MNNTINYLFKYYIFLISIDGAMKGIFLSSSLFFLAYLKDMILFSLLIITIISIIHRVKMTSFLFYSILVILFFTIIALNHKINIFQSFFMIKIFLIALITYELRKYINIHRLYNFSVFILFLTFFGLFVDFFVDFPWKGSAVEINGLIVEANSQGTIGGVFDRLSGFGVSNGVTGFLLISIYSILVILKYQKYNLFKIFDVIWFITFISILLTTSKTTIFTFILLTFYMFFQNKYILFKKIKFSILALKIIVLLYFFIPIFISIYFYQVYGYIDIGANSYFSLESDKMAFATIVDRVIHAWPETYSLVNTYGNIFLGRGIGGIGVSQKIFEPSLYTPGDGLFATLYATFGLIITILIIGYLVINLFKKNVINGYLILVVLLVGTTHNILDIPMILLVFFLFYNNTRILYETNSRL